MGNDSIFSIVILLVLFFVLPSVLKLLGRYTLSSRGPQETEEGQVHEAPGEEPAPSGQDFPAQSGYDTSSGPVISSEPIHPKWF